MQDLLQEIDADYYRAARLLIVHAEIAHLRRGSSAAGSAMRRSKITHGCSSPPDDAGPQPLRASTVQPAQSASPVVEAGG